MPASLEDFEIELQIYLYRVSSHDTTRYRIQFRRGDEVAFIENELIRWKDLTRQHGLFERLSFE